MDIFKIVGLGFISLVFIIVIKQYKPEFAVGISITVGIFMFAAVVVGIAPVMDEIREIFSMANLPTEYLKALFKALGICFLTQVACDACKDAGQGGIATKLEMAGKAAILVLSLPLFREVLSIATRLITG